MEKKTIGEIGIISSSIYPINLINGEINSCFDCYRERMSIRFNRITTETWENERILIKKLKRLKKWCDPYVAFPFEDEIYPENFEENMRLLQIILDEGNHVEIYSNLNLEYIKGICDRFESFKTRIQFSFSIRSANDSVLKFW
jgi:hypothetical protein